MEGREVAELDAEFVVRVVPSSVSDFPSFLAAGVVAAGVAFGVVQKDVT